MPASYRFDPYRATRSLRVLPARGTAGASARGEPAAASGAGRAGACCLPVCACGGGPAGACGCGACGVVAHGPAGPRPELAFQARENLARRGADESFEDVATLSPEGAVEIDLAPQPAAVDARVIAVRDAGGGPASGSGSSPIPGLSALAPLGATGGVAIPALPPLVGEVVKGGVTIAIGIGLWTTTSALFRLVFGGASDRDGRR